MTTELCPRCDKSVLRVPQVMNSLSRCTRGIEDEAVYICNPCGTDEAFEEFHNQGLTPVNNWPIGKRTNQETIDVLQVQHDIYITEMMEESL
jgi:hypothetical protein